MNAAGSVWEIALAVRLGFMTREQAVQILTAAGFVDAAHIVRDLCPEVER